MAEHTRVGASTCTARKLVSGALHYMAHFIWPHPEVPIFTDASISGCGEAWDGKVLFFYFFDKK